MKVIFLDVDGVLNSDRSIFEYSPIEPDLVLQLKSLVLQTDAKIVLSSSWRTCFYPLRKLMDALKEVDLSISGMTVDGVSASFIREKTGIEPSSRYTSVEYNYDTNGGEEITHDRGAEIYEWLSTHPDVKSFVILDDDSRDISEYFPNNLVKTNFSTGLTQNDIKQAIAILGGE